MLVLTVLLNSRLPAPRAELSYTTPILPNRICVVTLWYSWKYSYIEQNTWTQVWRHLRMSLLLVTLQVLWDRYLISQWSSKRSRPLLYTVKINSLLQRTAEKGSGKLWTQNLSDPCKCCWQIHFCGGFLLKRSSNVSFLPWSSMSIWMSYCFLVVACYVVVFTYRWHK